MEFDNLMNSLINQACSRHSKNFTCSECYSSSDIAGVKCLSPRTHGAIDLASSLKQLGATSTCSKHVAH